MNAPPEGLRARKKELVQSALASAAKRLFHARGFDATTIDDIAAEAGVSRRTFFRYFRTKEAVVFADRERRFDAFRAALDDGQPHAPFAAVRRALLALAAEYDANRAELVAEHRRIDASPALLAWELRVDREWEEAIAEALVRRMGKSERLRAFVMAAAVIGVVRATVRAWVAKGGKPKLTELGEQSLDLLEHGFSH